MNGKQKTVIWIAIIVIVFMFLIPPWDVRYLKGGPATQDLGHALKKPDHHLSPAVDVDTSRLALQIVVVAGIAAALVLVFKDK